MFAVLISAIWTAVAWVFRAVVVKALFYGFAVAFIGEVVPYVATKFPIGPSALTAALGNYTPGMWYFFDLFQMGPGMTLVLSAYVARFFIRRIPLIG